MASVERLGPGPMQSRVQNFPKRQVTAAIHRNLETSTLNYTAYQIIDSGIYSLGSIDSTRLTIDFNVTIPQGFISLICTLISTGDPFADSQVTFNVTDRSTTGFTVVFRELTPEAKNLKLSWTAICRDTNSNILETP